MVGVCVCVCVCACVHVCVNTHTVELPISRRTYYIIHASVSVPGVWLCVY